MFLCAIARPNPNFGFNGLVSCQSFTKLDFSQRESQNRSAGSLILKPITADGEAFKNLMINHV